MTANVKVATVLLGSIPASSDTVEIRGAAEEAVFNENKTTLKIPLLVRKLPVDLPLPT